MNQRNAPHQHIRLVCLLTVTLFASTALSGCIVAGASSTGGWFIWPGGLGILLLVLLYLFFFRGRR